MYYYGVPEGSSLAHAGKKGMKWGYNHGQRNGNRIAQEILESAFDLSTGGFNTLEKVAQVIDKHSPAIRRRRRDKYMADRIHEETGLSRRKVYRTLSTVSKGRNAIDKYGKRAVKKVRKSAKRGYKYLKRRLRRLKKH